jgi:hypothetical protein
MMRQPWIHSARIDGSLILAPGLVATGVALGLIAMGHGDRGLSLWTWGLLIVGIDVAHVYSTLYRTYLDPIERPRLAGWLVLTPLAAWAGGVLLYAYSAALFWTLLSYTAVFHFVRQQYGFMMLYSRAERGLPHICRRVDAAAIYAATLGPLLYWHTHLPRRFVWFIDGDFIGLPKFVWTATGPMYAALLGAYLLKEFWLAHTRRVWNLPRNGIVLGTAGSWWVGIVAAGGDLAFTLTNVVAHGLPYMALTFIYARGELQSSDVTQAGALRHRATGRYWLRWLPAAIGLLIALAYLEEGLWDGLVWREHLRLFPGFRSLNPVDADGVLTLLVPLLAMPQLTHYILDGVIWRMRSHPEWRRNLFWHAESGERA